MILGKSFERSGSQIDDLAVPVKTAHHHDQTTGKPLFYFHSRDVTPVRAMPADDAAAPTRKPVVPGSSRVQSAPNEKAPSGGRTTSGNALLTPAQAHHRSDADRIVPDELAKRPWEMEATYQTGDQHGAWSVRPKRSCKAAFDDPIRTVKDASKMLTQVRTKNGSDVTCFHGPDSPFSNWHHSPFVVAVEPFSDPIAINNDGHYTCMEQFLFVQKFRALEMHEIARQIKSTPDPDQQKMISRRSTVDPEAMRKIWFGRTQKHVLAVGIAAKFSDPRNLDLLHTLLLAKGDIVEAAGNDHIYGAGVAVSDSIGMQKIKTGSWRYQMRRGTTPKNLLGNALQNFRDATLSSLNPAELKTLRRMENDYQPEVFR